MLYFEAICIYTKKLYTPTIFLFVLGPNPVAVYVNGILTWNLKNIDLGAVGHMLKNMSGQKPIKLAEAKCQ